MWSKYKYTELKDLDGRIPVEGTTIYCFTEEELTNLIQAEKKQYLDEFARWFDGGSGKFKHFIKQFKKESANG